LLTLLSTNVKSVRHASDDGKLISPRLGTLRGRPDQRRLVGQRRGNARSKVKRGLKPWPGELAALASSSGGNGG
jgi:hypothetical protein